MQIWVDADACPVVVKEILFRAAERSKIMLTLVANQAIRIPPSRTIKMLQVAHGFDVADLRGERVRVFPDEQLRSRVKASFPDAIEWPPLGLPEDFQPLLAPSRFAFIRDGERIVGHGGISIEELVVPLVHIERNAK